MGFDVVTYALCRKGGGGTSAEVQQQIDEIKTIQFLNYRLDKVNHDLEIQVIKLQFKTIEGKVNEAANRYES